MSDTPGSAASLLAGNPGNPGDNTPTPPAPGAGEGGAPPASGNPPAAGASWLDSIQDAETKAWAESKGWKTPEDVAKSTRNLEKLLGGEKVPMPKDANDVEGWDRFFKAAGRPDAPDAYGLDKIEGADPEFSKAAADAFHKAGLNPQQVAGIVEFYGAHAKAAIEAQETAYAQQSQIDVAGLREEWGPAFDAKLDAAKRAVKLAGVDEATAQKIERAVGVKVAASLFAKIGEATTESAFRTANGGGGGDTTFLTPAAASEQKASLLKDPSFTARINAGDPAAKAQLDRLQRIAAGMAPA